MGTIYKRKACATCTYWGGSRKINHANDGVTCDKGTDEGVCGNPKSSFKKKDTRADYGGCTKYEKWDVLTKLKA